MCDFVKSSDAELLALAESLMKEIHNRFLSKINMIAEIKKFVKGQAG